MSNISFSSLFRKLTAICLVSILLWSTLLTAAKDLTFTSSPVAFSEYMTLELLKDTSMLKTNRAGVVRLYCQKAFEQGLATENEGQYLLYDPRQSVFLYFLCTHVDPNFAKKFEIAGNNLAKKYLKKTSFSDMQLICKSRKDGADSPKGCIPQCNTYPGADMGACDFSLLLAPLMRTILNDYSNIGLSLAYGVYASPTTQKIDDMLNELAMKYFGGIFYNESFNEYPKTLAHAKKFIKRARKFATRADILDIKKIRDIGNKKQKTDCDERSREIDGSSGQPRYDLLACPYSTNNFFAQQNTAMRGYINMMYNELFWYQLFVKYYAYMLRTNTSLLPFQISTHPVQKRDKLLEEALKLEQDVNTIFQAIKSTERTITNIHGAFWVHIGLYLYYEEALKFRNALAKTFTPIHQMFYKLRNVQQMQ